MTTTQRKNSTDFTYRTLERVNEFGKTHISNTQKKNVPFVLIIPKQADFKGNPHLPGYWCWGLFQSNVEEKKTWIGSKLQQVFLAVIWFQDESNVIISDSIKQELENVEWGKYYVDYNP
jgi:hypothetical protein